MSTAAAQVRASLPRIRIIDELCRRLLTARLRRLRRDCLILQEPDAASTFGRPSKPELQATIHIHEPAFYSAVALGGSIGAAESYARGEWTADDLIAVVRILVRNRDVLDAMERGLARFAAPARRALHWLNRNTRAGSRRNIEAHYDLGNEFFALFLDESLMYSSAVFEADGDGDLHSAQLAKLDRVCRKLQLRPVDHLLEIGSGWGSLAIHAAREYGCRVTTTTISPAQYALACERIRAAGLADRIEVLLADYRDLRGRYDKVVSIEMIEAIGWQYYETYFAKVSQLLAPDGLALIQSITIADHRYEFARRSVDFIQKYIFPGSTIPSIGALCNALMRASDLRLFHLEDIGPHYARTLRLWRERFLSRRRDVHALGHSEEFCRLWEFYFSYCEGGFEERAISDVQMLLVKPENRRAPLLTPLQQL
jgi:cyclopropane-fatty-acyl-phospholipid synthase